MSYVPGFDHDIFISYARADNIPLAVNLRGWVTDFCVTLENVLRPRLNRVDNLNPNDLSIWMDIRNIEGNAFWDDSIQKAAQKSAVLISIVSTPYVQSEYCRQEIETFSEQNDVGIEINGVRRNRIFKVLIDNFPPQGQPEKLRYNNGYDFFSADPVTKRTTRINLFLERDFPDPKYVSRIETLSAELAGTLHEMLKKPEEHSSDKDAKVVYLAEVPDELADERDAIRNELSQRNIIVLPTRGLSNNSENINRDIEDYLKRAEFYIHLLGGSYKRVSMDDNNSLTKIQHEIADRISETRGGDENPQTLKKLLWIKPGVDISTVGNESHREFLKSLVSMEGVGGQMEVIREPSIEILKDIIVKKIIPTVCKKPKILEKSSQIFISHIPEDEKEAKIIADILNERNHTVIKSLNSKDKKKSNADDLSQLRGCDAVVVLYGNDQEGSRYEVRKRLNRVMQIAKSRKNRQYLAKSLCDGPPDPKEELGVILNKNEWIKILCRNGFDPSFFEEFCKALASN